MNLHTDNAEQSLHQPPPHPAGGRPSGLPSLIGSIRRTAEAMREESSGLRCDPPRTRLVDFVWLVYSAFFFIEPIQRRNTGYWIEFAIFYVVFVAIYFGIIRAPARRTALLLLACMALLGIIYYPLNSGAAGIFIYVSAFTPFITDSIPINISTFATVSCIMMLEGMWMHLNPWSWGFTAFLALAIGSGNLVAAQKMRANQKLSLAHEEIAHLAKVAERERIARDLHDVLGHTLSVVVLKSELAGKLMQRNPERARKEIAEVENIARTALGEVRNAIRGYRSEGLPAELDRARITLDAAGVTLECPTEPPALRPAEETVLALIVREAVTNIVRHAQASHCRIGFEGGEATASLVVEDNGRGGIRAEGNGLRGMRERAESLGGTLALDSAQGTRLTIQLPRTAPRPS